MAELKTSKYVRTGITRPPHFKEVTTPIPVMYSDETFGNMGFTMYWECIDKPFLMEKDHHQHDFPQYLCFLGGDPTNLVDLAGEIELSLSEDGVNIEKHVFTQSTVVYIPAGLYHCPLNFKRLSRPVLFIDCFFSGKYGRRE
jgi:hypothetical protein